MNSRARNSAILGALVTSVLGTLLHFVYEWSGNNVIVGVLGAVNESTWEHLKLLFWPMFLFSLIELIWAGKRFPNFLSATLAGIFTGMATIVVVYYTYTGIIGRGYLYADIALFFIAVIVAYIVRYRLMRNNLPKGMAVQVLSLLVLLGLAAAFGYFSFFPPDLAIFHAYE